MSETPKGVNSKFQIFLDPFLPGKSQGDLRADDHELWQKTPKSCQIRRLQSRPPRKPLRCMPPPDHQVYETDRLLIVDVKAFDSTGAIYQIGSQLKPAASLIY